MKEIISCRLVEKQINLSLVLTNAVFIHDCIIITNKPDHRIQLYLVCYSMFLLCLNLQSQSHTLLLNCLLIFIGQTGFYIFGYSPRSFLIHRLLYAGVYCNTRVGKWQFSCLSNLACVSSNAILLYSFIRRHDTR